jgi:23S rRNA (pseudouridine1915-N3)-methyltransferase
LTALIAIAVNKNWDDYLCMINIFITMLRIFSKGKLKEAFYKSAENEYTKRINKFSKIRIEEIKNFDNIKCEFRILLDEKGKKFDSLSFSDILKDILLRYKEIGFIIGDWNGIDKKIADECDMILSLSPMTFPYQLSRIILLEQLYRAFTIIKGIDYHK